MDGTTLNTTAALPPALPHLGPEEEQTKMSQAAAQPPPENDH